MEPDAATQAAFKTSLSKLDRETVDRNLEDGGFTGWRRDAVHTESARRRRYAATMPGEAAGRDVIAVTRILARPRVRVALTLALLALIALAVLLAR